jgi:integrase
LEGSQLDLQRHTIAIGKPKSGNVAETAFIPPPLEALIGTLWPRALPKDRLFGLVTNVEDLSRVFGSIAKAAMVPGNSKDGWATLQDLRRAFGSRWSARVPAQVLQRIMRHSNIQVTLSFYAETDDAALQAIRNVAPSVARECGE